jgi:hypothetical protein
MCFQLDLFSDKPKPVSSIKKPKPRPMPRVIKSCTTKQAAVLLDVSVSTLYRSRQAGELYSKNGWTAQATGPNRWQVIV